MITIGERPDLSGDLRGASLKQVNLENVDLTGRDLSGAVFDGSDLSGARLTGSNLHGCSFRGATLARANLVETDLVGADFTECIAPRIILGQSDLTDAEFFGADLTGASLSGATAVRADFRAAKLDGARMLDVDLSYADFTRSSATESDLTRSTVAHTIFTEADLGKACLRGLRDFDKANWIDIGIKDMEFSGAYLVRRAIMDQNYLHEFRNVGRGHEILYQTWRVTSNCGRSFVRWGLLTAVVAVLFSILYTQVDLNYGDDQTTLSPFYFSVVTLTTLGYGDVLPASTAAQIVVLFEVVIGYVMLGGVLSIFATRMGRRAD